jgi:hypothetical protein
LSGPIHLGLAFQAAVFTKELPSVMRTYMNIDVSTAMVNHHSAF